MSEEEHKYDGPKFKVGDVVCLNSGGPLMTVITASDDDGDVECRWFRSQEGEQASFDEAYFNGDTVYKTAPGGVTFIQKAAIK